MPNINDYETFERIERESSSFSEKEAIDSLNKELSGKEELLKEALRKGKSDSEILEEVSIRTKKLTRMVEQILERLEVDNNENIK